MESADNDRRSRTAMFHLSAATGHLPQRSRSGRDDSRPFGANRGQVGPLAMLARSKPSWRIGPRLDVRLRARDQFRDQPSRGWRHRQAEHVVPRRDPDVR